MSDACGCGHDEPASEDEQAPEHWWQVRELQAAAAAAVFLLAAYIVSWSGGSEPVALALEWVALLIGAWTFVPSTLRRLAKGKIGVGTLMTIAAVGAVILGGIKSIATVTSKLVPIMGLGYVAACLMVIASNISHVPSAFGEILSGAFTPEAGLGGLVGVLIVGFQRAAFSNEAGLGSAPIAHSAVKTTRPVSEGFVALLEPFIDTVIICTMTALTIIIANPPSWREGIEGVKAGDGPPDGVLLTSDAFATFLPQFPVILAVMVGLFAFSTLITWSYYGEKAWEYFFGYSKPSIMLYKLIFVTFTVIGTILTFGRVLEITDAFLFICGFINLLGLYFLLPELKSEMAAYMADRKSGRLYELGAADEAELQAIREEHGNTGELPKMQSESAHDSGLTMEERARDGARHDIE